MKKNKIVIFGGAGFIGHNLALKLCKDKRNQLIIIDDLSVNNLNAKKHRSKFNIKLQNKILENRLKLLKQNDIKLIKKNINNNFKLIEKKILDYKPNYIYHLAAVSHATISNIDPIYTYKNSVNTLMNVLEIARKINSHIIYLSSSMVYGNFDGKKVNEKTICKPLGIYGNFKLMCENIIKSYNQVFNLNYTIIRPSALYGERCISRRVGQIFIENALMKKTILINGDGNDTLDFTYIEDFTTGLSKLLNNKNAINETFNLTYGSARKINDLLKILKKKFKNLNISYIKRDKLTPIRGTLSNKKINKLIGHKSIFSIDRGYKRYLKWYQNFYSKNIN